VRFELYNEVNGGLQVACITPRTWLSAETLKALEGMVAALAATDLEPVVQAPDGEDQQNPGTDPPHA
jgi:hypothetical protein